MCVRMASRVGMTISTARDATAKDGPAFRRRRARCSRAARRARPGTRASRSQRAPPSSSRASRAPGATLLYPQQETPQQETANNWLRSDSTFASSVISSGRNVYCTNISSSTKPEPCEDALGAPALHHSKRRPAKLDSFLSRAIGDVASRGLTYRKTKASARFRHRDARSHATPQRTPGDAPTPFKCVCVCVCV